MSNSLCTQQKKILEEVQKKSISSRSKADLLVLMTIAGLDSKRVSVSQMKTKLRTWMTDAKGLLGESTAGKVRLAIRDCLPVRNPPPPFFPPWRPESMYEVRCSPTQPTQP